MMFSSTVRLSASMKCWCTMPMPAAMASVGDLKCTSLPNDRDRALVGLMHAVEGLHQGRLAGAVLADDRVDRAGSDARGDVVVGDDTGEALRDAAPVRLLDARSPPNAGIADRTVARSRSRALLS